MKSAGAEDFHHFKVLISGLEYHYVDAFDPGAKSKTKVLSGAEATMGKGLVLLLHGFPDLWFGWRFQIQALVKEGYRVIAPDLVGYGETEVPLSLDRYTFQSVGRDMIELIDKVSPDSKSFYIGCHDWGNW